MKIFQSLSYNSFRPRTEALVGRRIILRSGVVCDPRWMWRTVYKNPFVVLRTFCISLFSLARRGVSPIEPRAHYGFVHSIWTNGYYHWLTESLPRALVMIREFPDAVPLLPKGNYESYAASLMCLGYESVEFFPRDRNVLVSAPVVTECARAFATTDPALLREVRQRVINFTCCDQPPALAAKIVYVSRSKARGRRVINESEVVEMMKSLGADIVCFEDLEFFDQVRIMAQTKILVSIHGAGLTNMMFMPKGGKIVEILPRKNGIFEYNRVRNSFKHDPCYVRLANAMEHEYHYLLATPIIKFYQKTHMADIKITTNSLRALVSDLI